MIAKTNILNSCTNVVAKINIRVFKIEEQLRPKFGKKLHEKSILYAVKNYGKFFCHYLIQFIFAISGMEATKMNIIMLLTLQSSMLP